MAITRAIMMNTYRVISFLDSFWKSVVSFVGAFFCFPGSARDLRYRNVSSLSFIGLVFFFSSLSFIT